MHVVYALTTLHFLTEGKYSGATIQGLSILQNVKKGAMRRSVQFAAEYGYVSIINQDGKNLVVLTTKAIEELSSLLENAQAE